MTGEAAILACGIYVDLNVIRAGCALSPETSEHTSAKLRIEARAEWLAPLELAANCEPGPTSSERPERASDKGFLPMPLADYLDLLDWTGRQVAPGKRGTIPAQLAPLLDRVGIPAESWVELSLGFGKLFHRVAGCPASIAREAARRSPRTFRSPGTRLLRTTHVRRR